MSRRSRGEGSIQQCADGSYRGSIRLPGGKRPCRRGKTRAEVVRKLDALKRHGSASRERFGAFLDRWLAYVKPNVRANTYAGYETIVRVWIKPRLGETRLSALRAEDCERLLVGVRSAGRSNRTVSSVRTVSIMALSIAEKWELVEKNWFKLSGAPKRQKKTTAHPLRAEEALAFLDHAESHVDRALMILAACTGARRGELMGAHWSDFALNADPPTWSIKRTLQRIPGGGLQAFPPKTDAGYRTLMLPARVINALKEHRVEQLKMRMKAGPKWKDDDYVFAGEKGQPLQPEYVADSFHALRKKAGIEKIRFHDLRHTVCVMLLAQGVQVNAVQKFMGHYSAAMTLDVYGGLLPDAKGAHSPLE